MRELGRQRFYERRKRTAPSSVEAPRRRTRTTLRVGHQKIRGFFEASKAFPFTVSRLGPITVSGLVAAFQLPVDFPGTGGAVPMTSTDVVTFDDRGLIRSMVAIPDPLAHPDTTG
jgi:hypothetical protein